jgi:hypothetical protein
LPVYAQVNPDIVGSENRDLEVALAYGVRLIGYSQNATIETVHNLVHDYPSHDFIIDDDELRTIFQNIDTPSENLYSVISHLGEFIYDEASPTIAFGITERPETQDQVSSEREIDDEANTGEGVATETDRGGTKPLDADRRADRPSHSGASEAHPPGSPPVQRGSGEAGNQATPGNRGTPGNS